MTVSHLPWGVQQEVCMRMTCMHHDLVGRAGGQHQAHLCIGTSGSEG